MNDSKKRDDPGAAPDPGFLLPGASSTANVFEETVERLGRSIKMGLIVPGQQLPPERELARMMGISRTTMRAAIGVLVEGGFLVSRRGRGGGTFVSDAPPRWRGADDSGAATWDERRAQNFLDKRTVVECGVAELAAARANAAALGEMRGMVEEMGGLLDDFDAFRACDARFHIALARCTLNPDLTRMVLDIQADLGELLVFLPPSKDALIHSNHQHAEIIEAIENGAPDAARAAMKAHLKGTEHFLGGLLPSPSESGP
ncbi:FadR/GntR family transcriptional regulator [Roseovarius spongiae]|nr:FCD domain-containing protein [Roseovarius spongiae]